MSGREGPAAKDGGRKRRASSASSEVATPPSVSGPIVVPNTTWTPADPNAYGGGQPASIDHLKELELGDKSDNARWGALDVVPTTADLLLDYIRANSLWPLLSGLACCAMEMMSAATSVNDMDRFNMFPFRASPRQADVLIVAGTLTTKMAGPLIRLWEQMPEPKWCVAMGDCTCSGGRYKRSYSTVEGIDRIMPVDVYVPGCPPRPEGLIYGMLKLQQLILERRGTWAERRVGPTVPAGV
jgi:NADH-quinone oxidoreductase subunit B